jgi:hypothetical protein
VVAILGWTMGYYRLYFMSSFSGHIERFEEFDAPNDASAVALAKTKQGLFVLELWCSQRKVARVNAIDLTSELLAERTKRKAVKARIEPDAIANEDSEAENRSA